MSASSFTLPSEAEARTLLARDKDRYRRFGPSIDAFILSLCGQNAWGRRYTVEEFIEVLLTALHQMEKRPKESTLTTPGRRFMCYITDMLVPRELHGQALQKIDELP